MERETIRRLMQVNRDFYALQAESFSSTRRNSSPGWNRVAARMRQHVDGGEGAALHVLDLACGNFRFEAFLERALAPRPLRFTAVDACVDFADMEVRSPLGLVQLDLLEALVSGGFSESLPKVPVAVCFGFMHHIPSFQLRLDFLRQMLACLEPGGVACLSFWCFLEEQGLSSKAQESSRQGRVELGLPPLEEGDCLLGWQNRSGVYRYCHSFTDAELDALLEALGQSAVLLDRYKADGRNDRLDSYLVLQATR